jgi:hypothetical protein
VGAGEAAIYAFAAASEMLVRRPCHGQPDQQRKRHTSSCCVAGQLSSAGSRECLQAVVLLMLVSCLLALERSRHACTCFFVTMPPCHKLTYCCCAAADLVVFCRPCDG